MAVCVRSPAAFKGLKSLDILQMPGRASYFVFEYPKAWHFYDLYLILNKRIKGYDQHCDQKSMSEKPKPVGEGVLVFDEVKVQNGVSRMLYLYCMYIEIIQNPFFWGVCTCARVFTLCSNDLLLTIS